MKAQKLPRLPWLPFAIFGVLSLLAIDVMDSSDDVVVRAATVILVVGTASAITAVVLYLRPTAGPAPDSAGDRPARRMAVALTLLILVIVAGVLVLKPFDERGDGPFVPPSSVDRSPVNHSRGAGRN